MVIPQKPISDSGLTARIANPSTTRSHIPLARGQRSVSPRTTTNGPTYALTSGLPSTSGRAEALRLARGARRSSPVCRSAKSKHARKLLQLQRRDGSSPKVLPPHTHTNIPAAHPGISAVPECNPQGGPTLPRGGRSSESFSLVFCAGTCSGLCMQLSWHPVCLCPVV